MDSPGRAGSCDISKRRSSIEAVLFSLSFSRYFMQEPSNWLFGCKRYSSSSTVRSRRCVYTIETVSIRFFIAINTKVCEEIAHACWSILHPTVLLLPGACAWRLYRLTSTYFAARQKWPATARRLAAPRYRKPRGRRFIARGICTRIQVRLYIACIYHILGLKYQYSRDPSVFLSQSVCQNGRQIEKDVWFSGSS